MAIWKHTRTLEQINEYLHGTMCEHVGIEIIELGADFITAKMPVDERTQQHMGIIHGGASVVLAETVGSIAAGLCCPDDSYTVGLDINANHIGAGNPPYVTGKATPIHVGSSTSVWEIRIQDADGKLVCISRLTCAVLKKRSDQPRRVALPDVKTSAQQEQQ